MWHDPLAELIEDLERATPPITADGPPAFAQLMRYTDVILYGSAEAQRRLDRDPKFHAFTAAMASGVKRIVLAGGVAANSRLRAKMVEKAAEGGLQVFCPAPKFCTDNAAMIALTGYHWLKRGRRDDFCLNADADLTL